MKLLLSLSLLLLGIPTLGAIYSLDDTRDLNSMTLTLPNESLIKRNIREPINVLYDKDGFMVANNSNITRVNLYDVDPELRKMDVNKAAKLLIATQLQVSQLSNGEYTIAQHGELRGGGPLGAAIGFYVGKG